MYTPLRIYEALGRTDEVATITFKNGSDSNKTYGAYITVVFLYTQVEREAMDAMLAASEPGDAAGYIKARLLVDKLSPEREQTLTTTGVFSADISSILSSAWSPEKNTFHSTETRKLNKIDIPFQSLPKGGDCNWMYGFDKRRWEEGIGFSPGEASEFLGRKIYFEPENLTPEEQELVFDNNGIRKDVELEYLTVLYHREEINAEQKKLLGTLTRDRHRERLQALDAELKTIGSSNRKLAKNSPDKAGEIGYKVMRFKERRLNVIGKHPIFIDLQGFLHIWMRHVKDMKINNNFAHKDDYQWEEPDVIRIMQNIIEIINDEAQSFFESTPNTRFSKYGPESVYYQGDYYTLHIEPNGRIGTIYKNTKQHERKKKVE